MRKWLFFPTAILCCALLLSCGRTAVKHTSINGAVKNNAGWQVVVEDITDIPAQGSPDFDTERQKGLLFREKATAEYRDKIISGLREKDLPISLSGDADVINIRINWHQRQIITPQPRVEEKEALQDDRQRAGSIKDDSLVVGLDEVTAAFLPENNRVNRVEVDLSNVAGLSLGKIFIGDNVEDKIKPEFVAKVIAKILRDGEY